MDNYTISFKRLCINKVSACFTWDDNFIRHAKLIAPLFAQYEKRCSFYINVGDGNFSSEMASDYHALIKKGFEIGSHGYNHIHMDQLPINDFVKQMQLSLDRMIKIWQHRPTTFAFPHHDYNDEILILAKSVFLETRNTLDHGKRISLKSHSTLLDIASDIDNMINNNLNIVFSGHSVKIPEDEQSNYTDGYEPVQICVIDDILNYLEERKDKIEIITFEQAALKEYIKQKCSCTNTRCELSSQTLLELTHYGFNINKILSLL